MHSPREPRGPVTYGHGDVNGDGSPDLVAVNTDGRIWARLGGGRQLRAGVPASASLRLQALADLFGGGRADIMVASSAAGCCRSYQLLDASSVVLIYRHQRLKLLHYPSGRLFVLLFNTGRGDAFAGIRCSGHQLTQTTVFLAASKRLSVTASTYRLTRNTVTRRELSTRTVSGSERQALALTTTKCPGMNRYGWAG